ncbi:MAG: transpeptidase family protein, partial [Bacteroidales bacterium]|nr:transpeptidase family protein [Bacteroidales bacterium]
MKNIRADILWRVFLVYVMMLLFGIAIIARVIHIQVVERSDLLAKADSMSIRSFDIEAVRGNIYADDGSLLATSVPIFDIRMDVASPLISNEDFNQNISPLAQKLSALFGNKSEWQYKNDLIKARQKGNRYFLVKNNVTYEQLKKLREFPIFDRGKYKGGLIIIPKTKRQKPFGSLAYRTIGYENKTEDLFVGLEGAYSEVLSGHDGKQLRRRINNGDWVPLFDENEVEPINGKDIITTIDVNLQDVAESSLHNHLLEHNAEWGCAVLMEVHTGKILAIANLTRVGDTYKEAYNYAVGQSIEPGSTFKLPSMMALFEDGLENLDDTVNIGKGYKVYSGLTIQDVHGIRDGRVSIREIFEKSSNAGVSMLVYDKYSAQPQKFIDHLYDMSLKENLGLEIPGEGDLFIKDTKHKSWSNVSLPFMSIGYELRITPLQLLTFYNAVANNGEMVKPMFVQEIWDAGKKIKSFEPTVINSSICSESTLEMAHEILEGVVLQGTATSLKSAPYTVAGKTGTAQIASSTGYDKRNYNASFAGYFPAENPEYSCVVVVSKPSTGRYYASSVAVPVFREIADKVYATNLEIQRQDSIIESEDYPLYAIGYQGEIKQILDELNVPVDTASTVADWAIVLPSDSAVVLKSRIIHEGIIPNVKGMGARDAVYVLENLGLKVNILGRGFVKQQSLSPG